MPGGSRDIREEDRLDEVELVQRIKKRDARALNQVILLFGDRVLGLCEVISFDKLDAESVTSDVFLELWNRPEAFDPSRGRLKTYLLTLARCRSIDRRRSRVARETKMNEFISQASYDPSLYAHELTAEACTLGAEKRRMVDAALCRLPEAQRVALKLAFFQGLTHMEVAEKLALPLGTVKSHIRRGLLHLKGELAGKFDVGETL